MSFEVVVVDYGSGNIGSILSMLVKIGVSGGVAKTPEDLLVAQRVILPGVGSFDNAMEKLAFLGLDNALKALAGAGVPILGVCLGMQLLLSSSEEGSMPGLGLIPGTSRRFGASDDESGLRIPHMGWNSVDVIKPSRFIPSLGKGLRYYFVHSYRVEVESEADILGKTQYGGYFPSAIERSNVVGVQFHPEKSLAYGGRMLLEFVSSR